MVEQLKVVVVGDRESSLKFIQYLKESSKAKDVQLGQYRTGISIDDKEVYFYYVPYWQDKSIEMKCYGSDACILMLYDESYECLPEFKKVYDVFKKVTDNDLVIVMHDKPTKQRVGKKVAETLKATYISVSLDSNNFDLILTKISQYI